MATVTSLYICISYIYTYFYNFNSLSSYIPIACQTFSVTCSMSFSSFGSMIYCILCTITYIISYPVPILCLLPCTVHFIYCFPVILFILHFHTCTIVYVHILSIIYFVLSYTFITFLVFIYLFSYQFILYFLFL